MGINKIDSPSDRKSDREGETPWENRIIEGMPMLPSVDVPNGVAHPSGPSPAGPYTFTKDGFVLVDDWGGNRTGE